MTGGKQVSIGNVSGNVGNVSIASAASAGDCSCSGQCSCPRSYSPALFTAGAVTTSDAGTLSAMIQQVQTLPALFTVEIPKAGDKDQEIQALSKSLQSACSYRFQSESNYAFNGNDTKPHNLAPGHEVTSRSDFTTTYIAKPDCVEDYIGNTLVDETVPDWCVAGIKAQIKEFVHQLLGSGSSDFALKGFNLTLNPTEGGSAGLLPHTFTGVACYSIANLDHGEGAKPYLLLYYVGVHYSSQKG